MSNYETLPLLKPQTKGVWPKENQMSGFGFKIRAAIVSLGVASVLFMAASSLDSTKVQLAGTKKYASSKGKPFSETAINFSAVPDWQPPMRIGTEPISKILTSNGCINADLPVLRGVDVVAYFHLLPGERPIYGFPEIASSVYKGFTFLFSSSRNKELFEDSPVRYIPAWGNFGAYGMAFEQEKWSNPALGGLGPSFDPALWKIGADGRLYFFEDEAKMLKFLSDEKTAVIRGNLFWKYATDGCPTCYNTACTASTVSGPVISIKPISIKSLPDNVKPASTTTAAKSTPLRIPDWQPLTKFNGEPISKILTSTRCIDQIRPVLGGVDVVAFFSMKAGSAPMFGSVTQSVVNGFKFRFSSEENKELFEANPAKYFPAWGGFGAFGMAFEQEKWSNPIVGLGPTFNPAVWKIGSDGRLYVFESIHAMEQFSANEKEAIIRGNLFWKYATDNCPDCFNTACPTVF